MTDSPGLLGRLAEATGLRQASAPGPEEPWPYPVPVRIRLIAERYGLVALAITMDGEVDHKCTTSPVKSGGEFVRADLYDRLRRAALEAVAWHEEQDEALSSEPPGGDRLWRRAEHQEKAQALLSALEVDGREGAGEEPCEPIPRAELHRPWR